MSESEINTQIEEYAKNFEIRFKDNSKLRKREYAKVIADGGYAKVLDADARRSVLALEKLKSMMGMETLVDMGSSPVAAAPAPVEVEPAVEAAQAEVVPEG